MNKTTLTKLSNGAKVLEQFRHLADSEQEWLIEVLKVGKSALLALDILDAIASQPLTFEEIGRICECHPQTASQILNALVEGGMSLSLNDKSAYAPTGRPRKLAKK